MARRFPFGLWTGLGVLGLLGWLGFGASSEVLAEDRYAVDPAHTAVVFRIKHLNMSYIYGRFNKVKGRFNVDPQNASHSSFTVSITTDSIDTNLKKRDDHLRGPDFFNAKQFPVIVFESTGVEAIEGGYRVTGSLSLHGVTQTISLDLHKMGEGDDPWGNYRMGFVSEYSLKRSDFGMTQMPEAVGDGVLLLISFEGLRQ